MTSEAFQKGFAALATAFPGMQFNSELFWVALIDIDGQYFLTAVMNVIKNTKELFPGSNIIAILRARAEELRLEALKNSTLKIEQESEMERIERWKKEATPMPEDCRVALNKLGITI